MIKCLMLGAGHTPPMRKLKPIETSEEGEEWVRLDMNPDCHPDVEFNLDLMERGSRLPFADEEFDEIHAYETLEHYGRQGDYKGFFCGWRELWRVLKPDGHVIGTCPSWNVMWTFGDPGHTRVITEGTLSYLTKEMEGELGKGPATDYSRFVRPYWWKQMIAEHDPKTGGFLWAMKKV